MKNNELMTIKTPSACHCEVRSNLYKIAALHFIPIAMTEESNRASSASATDDSFKVTERKKWPSIHSVKKSKQTAVKKQILFERREFICFRQTVLFLATID